MTAADTVKDIHVEVKRCTDCGARFGVDAEFCPFCGVPLSVATWDPTRDPLVGTVVDKRYEVHEPLGEGGMGTVYRVRHVTLDRMFAMKVLRRDLATDAALAARFVQEARATAAIKHPGIVAITDFGELDDGLPYFIMELLAGETLATRMRARGPMQPLDVLSIAKKIAEALQASHEAGVVHRDLKPENVFLVGTMVGKSAGEEIRIVDFGAAKVVGGSKLTRPGIVFGTPYYMSPEQASGSPVDARADVYSLGVLMFEMITGNVPFEADTYMGVLTKHMFATPPKPSERAPSGVQLGPLEDVVLRTLEKDPAARFASMNDLARALDSARAGRTVLDSRRPPGSPGSAAPQPLSTADRIELSVTKQVLKHERARRSRVVLTAVGAAAATTILGAAALRLLPSSGGVAASSAARPEGAAVVSAATSAVGAATSVPTSEPVAATAATAVTAVAPPAPTPLKEESKARPRFVSPAPLPAPSPPPSKPPKRHGSDEFADPWTK